MRRTVATLGAVLLVLTSGCGGAGSGTSSVESAKVTAADEPLRLAIVGNDQVTLTACAGCTGWLAQFRDQLSERFERPVEVTTLLADDDSVPHAVQEVGASDPDGPVAAADVVVVNIGGGNVLPDPDTGIGCGGSIGDGSGAAIAAWIRTTTPECMAQGVKTYGTLFDQVFTALLESRGDKPTVWVVLNSLNNNIDPDDGQSLLAVLPPKDRSYARAWALDAYERWNRMVQERATAAGFEYVDVWHALNGRDGTVPLGRFAVDGSHLSQAGNDVVANALEAVDLSELTSR